MVAPTRQGYGDGEARSDGGGASARVKSALRLLVPIRLAQLPLHVVSGYVPARGGRAMARPDLPRTMAEFRDRLASEEDRRRHLVACRWPDGFRCPRRGSRDAYEPAGRELGLTA